MMNEPIKLTKQLITFSLDSELIKNFKSKAKEENFKYSKLIELLIKNYLKPNIEDSNPPKVKEKEEYSSNELNNEEILKNYPSTLEMFEKSIEKNNDRVEEFTEEGLYDACINFLEKNNKINIIQNN